MAKRLALGPVMLDVAGKAFTDEDRQRLLHPHVGAVILFARNYESPAQLAALTAEISALREPRLLIGVDHEGGRVQRFRTGYSAIPPMRALGRIWDADHQRGLEAAQAAGLLIALELAGSGVDFTFAPVLDLDFGRSGVIGDRSFHGDPEAVSQLAAALIAGLACGGLTAVGKHFPGHGYAIEDSHVAIPSDPRSLDEIRASDMVPYGRLAPLLGGVMPAHVTYPAADPNPAGFSPFWLQRMLRGELQFDGAIFSDDLSMEGASVVGGIVARARAALGAGCDVAVVCNRPASADELLAGLGTVTNPRLEDRLGRLRARALHRSLAAAQADAQYVAASATLAANFEASRPA
jgi:beta-N-acetylhexosaminidase